LLQQGTSRIIEVPLGWVSCPDCNNYGHHAITPQTNFKSLTRAAV